MTACFPSATQSKIGWVSFVCLPITCLNVVRLRLVPFSVSASSYRMTPLAASYFLMESTRIYVDCLHILGMVVGGKWMYPAADEATTIITIALPMHCSGRQLDMNVLLC